MGDVQAGPVGEAEGSGHQRDGRTDKGPAILAIFEPDGDTLRICYDLSGKARPTEFSTKEGTKLFLVTYKREER